MPVERDLDALADELLAQDLEPEMPSDTSALADDDADDVTTPDDGTDAFDDDLPLGAARAREMLE